MSTNRVIIITGGASGIGLGITRHFAPQPNTHVAILDVNATAGEQVLSELRSEFSSASLSFATCDVSSWGSQVSAFENIFVKHGKIDIVFANAGITEKGSLLTNIHAEKPSKPNLVTLDVDLVGAIYTVNLAAHYIGKNKPSFGASPSKGCIICTASSAGLYPFPIAPIYSTAKHGVVGLVRSLARSLQEEQIQINGLAPVVIETNIVKDSAFFKSMVLTPMSSAIAAIRQLTEDTSLTGQIAEVHGLDVTLAAPKLFVDEDTGKNVEMFWTLRRAW